MECWLLDPCLFLQSESLYHLDRHQLLRLPRADQVITSLLLVSIREDRLGSLSVAVIPPELAAGLSHEEDLQMRMGPLTSKAPGCRY